MPWLSLLLSLSASADPAQPASPEPGEAEFRAACSKEKPWNCQRLAYQLQAGSWGDGRRAEALEILERSCGWGDKESCGMGLVMARQDGDPEPIRLWSERACDATFATACVALAEREKRPKKKLAQWKRACAAAGDWETCSVAEGRRDPEARGPAPPDAFTSRVQAARATFAPPAGFELSGPSPADVFPADYVLRSDDGAVEIRYLVLPWGAPLPPAFGDTAVPADQAGLLLLLVAHHVYTGAEAEQAFSEFPQTAQRLEFNTDRAFLDAPHVAPALHLPYAVGEIILLHREGAGDLLEIVLSRDLAGLADPAQTAFHALRFAEPVGL